ncbi:putative solute carrier family 35 member F6-like isoform X1 [Trypanosoma grayi]|uniref:putative solute carrier family 35 member F6-like isoform X1 n=1 Tax=Trypanosoma grayi TaxID=71804 RepID=UPI0004F3EF43|nr:putative solute carrier family 35 member F6-like isoform X1 [Trypanosoma grayi]KEG06374.1 putative solute carrier family 35 member F6-like isoform X1 [Trypanosoma grayi]
MPRLAFLAVLSAAYIAWGTVQSVTIKWADTLTATDRFHQYTYSFAHPFVQALVMFFSESLCLILLGALLTVKKYVRQQAIVKGEDVALPNNPIVWMLPAGADFVASIMQNAGLTLTYVSVYQMLRGAVVVFITLLSLVWLRRRFTRQEYFGVLLVTVGLTLVGLSSVLRHSASTGAAESANRNPFLGGLLIVVAQVMHAYQGVCEERLVKLYRVPPLQMVGTEGAYGVGMALMLLALLQLVPLEPFYHNVIDPPENDGDIANMTATLRVPYDDVILAFDQMRECTPCLLSMGLYVLGGFFYNVCQVTIIKHFSAAACVMVGSLRNVTVWAVALALPSIFEEHFSALQLLGFCFLVAGNVMFQHVIPDAWWRCCYPSMLAEDVAVESVQEGAARTKTQVGDGA